jgi:hypothetical protein
MPREYGNITKLTKQLLGQQFGLALIKMFKNVMMAVSRTIHHVRTDEPQPFGQQFGLDFDQGGLEFDKGV